MSNIVQLTLHGPKEDGGPSVLQRFLNIGKRCVGIFAKSSPPEPNPEADTGTPPACNGDGGHSPHVSHGICKIIGDMMY